MDVDMLNSWGSESDDDSSSMDMMGMIMQMEKCPELYDQPFYNNNSILTLTNNIIAEKEKELCCENSTPPVLTSTLNINYPIMAPNNNTLSSSDQKKSSSSSSSSSMATMREMIFRMAVMQPIHIDPESIKAPKRRNVRISKDPQSVAARHRRERISQKIRTLQRLVPGGTKMDTASMLDEAIHYVKFLKKQVQTLEQTPRSSATATATSFNVVGYPAGPGVVMSNANLNYYYSPNLLRVGCQPSQMLQPPPSKQMLS